MSRSIRRDQSGVSPVIGGILLLGITLVFAGALMFMGGTLRQDAPDPVETGARGVYTQDGYVVTLVGPQEIPLDGGGRLVASIDGTRHDVPLSQVSAQLGNATVWKVGESLCIVGPPPCFFPNGQSIGVSVVVPQSIVFDIPEIQYVVPGPSFLTRPNGGVELLCDMGTVVRILGVAITNGPTGPAIPVTASLSTNGAPPFSPLNAGNPVWGGEVYDLGTLPQGSVLGIQGRANDGSFDETYDSFSGDPHVLVLHNYDPAPSYAPYGGQEPLEAFLAPYVNTDNSTMVMGPNEELLLFEFTPNLSSSAADFQDLAVLFQFNSGGC